MITKDHKGCYRLRETVVLIRAPSLLTYGMEIIFTQYCFGLMVRLGLDLKPFWKRHYNDLG